MITQVDLAGKNQLEIEITILKEFTCDATAQNRNCLPLDKICDGVADCKNDRDEKGCEEGAVSMPNLFVDTTAG